MKTLFSILAAFYLAACSKGSSVASVTPSAAASSPTTAANNSGDSEGYLGSDELKNRLAVSIGAAVKVLEALPTSGSLDPLRLCPLPSPQHELYPFLHGVTSAQVQEAVTELQSLFFRTQLINALSKIEVVLKSPSPAWKETEEARVPLPIPLSAKIPTYFNEKKILDYSIESLTRVVIHEALHLLHNGMADEVAYGNHFSSFRLYANYLGACLGSRLTSALRMDGTYLLNVSGSRSSMVIRLQNENDFVGHWGAIPGGPQGRRNLQGKVKGNVLEFAVTYLSSRYICTGAIDQLNGKYLLNGNCYREAEPGKLIAWNAEEIAPLFSDFDFVEFASRWRLFLGGPAKVSNEQLISQPAASYQMAPKFTLPNYFKGSVLVDVTLANSANAGGAGILLTDPAHPQECLTLFVLRQSSVTSLVAWKCKATSPFESKELSRSANPFVAQLRVKRCNDKIIVSVNEQVIFPSIGFDKVAPLDLHPETDSGIIIGGDGAYLSNFIVENGDRCRP